MAAMQTQGWLPCCALLQCTRLLVIGVHTLMRTSPFLGGSTVTVVTSRGFLASQAMAARQSMGCTQKAVNALWTADSSQDLQAQWDHIPCPASLTWRCSFPVRRCAAVWLAVPLQI